MIGRARPRCLLVRALIRALADGGEMAYILDAQDRRCWHLVTIQKSPSSMNDSLDLLQWPAMAVTVGAGVLVGSRARMRRKAGFIAFLLSNALWIAWGWHDDAWALIALQLCLMVTNVRGILKNEEGVS
jgi:hypothetical protein